MFPSSPLSEIPPLEDESACDGDMLVQRHEGPQVILTLSTSARPVAMTQTTPLLLPLQSDVVPTAPGPSVVPQAVTMGQPPVSLAVPSTSYPDTSEVVV